MERCLLAALIVFPFAVMAVTAAPLLPGTTATFFAALCVYGLWLMHQRGREKMSRTDRA